MTDANIVERIRAIAPAADAPFSIAKIGHVVLNCRDLERSVRFYTRVLGFRISDVYDESMIPGGMCFMRFGADHHGVGLVGDLRDDAVNVGLHHLAFGVSTIDEVFRMREHLERNNVPIDFHGRRRAGAQIAVEFRDPDGHELEIYWGIDQVGSDGITRSPSEWKPAKSLEEAVANPASGQFPVVGDERLIRRT